MGAGVAGIETVFALIIIAGYVLGPSFGFNLGILSILVSALIGGGVGPWLPFQMIAASIVGLGAGFIPKPKSKTGPLFALSFYAVIASYLYGALMTVWTWPIITGGTSMNFDVTRPWFENFMKFLNYELVSGGLLWDTGRAITTVVLITLSASTLIATLNRAATRVEVKVEG